MQNNTYNRTAVYMGKPFIRPLYDIYEQNQLILVQNIKKQNKNILQMHSTWFGNVFFSPIIIVLQC